jgi:pimeloyl-ACP methyl ester carboxylesterase
VATLHRELPLGRMRSRSVGQARVGVPEVVLVQGMAVADYLMPGLGALGSWTQAHLVELPGYAGSGDPPHELDVPGYGQAVADWLDAADLGPVVLMGHSSGTQVAAHAAIGRPERVAALVLASPTVDPAARSLPRLLFKWRLDGRHEPPGLQESHKPEWKRAGPRRLAHTVRIHLRDRLEEVVPRVDAPVLVLRGREDRLLTEQWARELTVLARDGWLQHMPGAHTFPWLDPDAWSDPVCRLALEVA